MTCSIWAFLLPLFEATLAQTAAPEGWASVDSLGQNGTTGGQGGEVVVVRTATEFLSYIRKPGPYIIRVDGVISLSDMVNVQPHKSIIGVGSNGIITGGGLNISQASNIIIRNLLFEKSLDDAINIEDKAHHVWIDHCDFTNAFDGLVDIKTGGDFVTVSWNRFYNHTKTCLLGHNDNNAAQDSGHLRVTYHHNWFDGTAERHPRARFSALCHVYNNFYVANSYGIASTMNAEVLVESNYFRGVSFPTHVGYGTSGPGDLVERNNIFDNCSSPAQVKGEVPEPPYIYSLDSSADVPTKVTNGAGRVGYSEPAPVSNWLIYDASVLPDQNAPPFSPMNVTNAPDTTSWIVHDPDIEGNKLLAFVDSTKVAGKFMWGINWQMDSEKGATIAFRVKRMAPSIFQRTFEVEFRDGSLRERLLLFSDGTLRLDRADVAKNLPANAEGWHTYRITFKKGLSTIYLDEEASPFLTGTSASESTGNDVRFGDGSDEETYGFYLDWLVIDTTGTYAPTEKWLPEGLRLDVRPPTSNWIVYDASVLPNENDPVFVQTNFTNPPDTTSWIVNDPDIPGNKLLKFVNSVKVAGKFMWGINWNMVPSVGATMAFRVKPLDPSVFQRTFEVEFRDGSIRERFFVLPGGEIELDRADVKNVLPARVNDWHTYRITYKNGASEIYVDEAATPSLMGTSSSANSSNDVRFGDGSDGNTHGFLLDWLIFDITGAYPPGEGSPIPANLWVDVIAKVDKSADSLAPDQFVLKQNYPNPFNPSTTIEFSLPRSGRVTVAIYNPLGQALATILDEHFLSGTHRLTFSAGELTSGIYFYKVKSGEFAQVGKMLLLR